jgi:hypothetical protein
MFPVEAWGMMAIAMLLGLLAIAVSIGRRWRNGPWSS